MRAFAPPSGGLEEDYSAGVPVATAPHLLAVAWRRKWIVVSAIAIALACGWMAYTRIPPTYSSVAKLHVRQSIPRVAVGQVGPAGPSFSVNTEFEIIKSTSVLEQALELPALATLPAIRAADAPVQYLQSVLDLSAGRADDIILIGARCRDPDLAAVIANTVAEAYTGYNAQQQKSSSADVLRALQQEKDRRETEYRQIKDDLDALRRRSGMLTIDPSKGNVLMQKLGELSAQLAAAEMETTEVRIIVQRLDDLRLYPVPLKAFIVGEAAKLGFAGGSLVDQAEVSRQRLAESLREMEVGRGPNHPEVIRTRALLAQVSGDGADDQFTEAFRVLTAQRLATAELRASELRAQFDRVKDQALNMNAMEQEYAQLQNDAARTEKLLDLLDSRIKEVDLNGVSGALTVSTLDAARPDPVPVSPQRERILGLALVVGLALGLSLASVRDLLDQRLRSLEEIEATMGTRILGAVPTLGKRVHPILAGKAVDTRPVSDVAESYRSIRTSIFTARSRPIAARTILVTSAVSGDGKSTTASNLAIATAQMGRRVLLIDADCRMPSLHAVFGVGDGLKRGLSTVLTAGASPEETVRPTGIENLDLMTAGPLTGRPAEMLNGTGFSEMLGRLAERYDHIFIDSPPVIPVSDARVMAARCDLTVLVLRADRSTRKHAVRARDAIEGVGGRLIGIVVNDTPRREARYGNDFEVYAPLPDDDRPARAGKRRRVVRRSVAPALTDGTALAGATAVDATDVSAN